MIKIFVKYVESGFFFTIPFIAIPVILYTYFGFNLFGDYAEYLNLGTSISEHKLYVNLLVHITFIILFIYVAVMQLSSYMMRKNDVCFDEDDLLIISSNINKFIVGLIILESTYISYLFD